jgi:D-serine dehydratase
MRAETRPEASDAPSDRTMKVDGTTKGMPPEIGPVELSRVGDRGWNLLEEDLALPAAVLRRDALEHNSRWMRRFLSETGARLCPHGKTSMAPELFRRQLRDGAWGVTVADVRQLRVCRRHGISRVLLANQLVREASIRWIAEELERDPGFDFWCLVDSVPGVRRLAEATADAPGRRPVELLVEVGHPGGRAGCRSVERALEVAEAVRDAGRLALRGVEGFEGLLGTDGGAEAARREVVGYLDGLTDVAEAIDANGLFADGEVLLTAGGSAYFDLALERLQATELGGRGRVVLRSGCYLTHDVGMYARAFSDLRERSPRARSVGDGFRPALEIWSYVQSRPEPGRAILTMGKRDCSFDVDLPVPRRLFRPGRDDRPRPLDDGCRISRLDDQHAYLDLPGDADVRVGDMVACGISHPCTTFDRWRVVSLVDRTYDVVGAVHTEF